MRVKSCIAGCILLLALNGAGAKLSFSATTASPAAIEHGSAAQWKSIPEDSTSWRREPFKNNEASKKITGSSAKPASIGAASPELALSGIMKNNKHYYAIINGRTVKPGDHVDEWTIAEISRYRVTMRRQKEKQIYDIYQGRIDRGTR
jgi:hypothetical protein